MGRSRATKRLGQWAGENPLALVRQFKIEERELSFLTLEQIQDLLTALEVGDYPGTILVARVCLATGARWSEAEGLKNSQVRGGQVHFSKTKSGKNRSVPIDDVLFDALRSFNEGKGRLFQGCYFDFSRGIDRAGIELPKGQLTHVLRHTFASHFMMNGGSILALQRILGHSNLTMTMRYAHLAPEHLQEAKTLNPLTRLTVG